MEQLDFERASRSYRVAFAWFDAICTGKIQLQTAELVRAYQIADEWCTLLTDRNVILAVYSHPTGKTPRLRFPLLYGPKPCEVYNRCPNVQAYGASLDMMLHYRGEIAAKVAEKMSIVWSVMAQIDFSDCDEDDVIAIRRVGSLRRAEKLFKVCNRIPDLKAEFDMSIIDPLSVSESEEENIAACWNAFAQVGTEFYINYPAVRRRFNKAILSAKDFLAECEECSDPVLQASLKEII